LLWGNRTPKYRPREDVVMTTRFMSVSERSVLVFLLVLDVVLVVVLVEGR
jgi:hypothetical protein